MTASREPGVDPQQDAATLGGALRTPEELARERQLAALFGDPVEAVAAPAMTDAEKAARHDQLAALFSGQPAAPPPSAGDPVAPPVVGWGAAPVADGGAAPVVERGGAPAVDDVSAPAVERGAAPEVGAVAAPAAERDDTPVVLPARRAGRFRRAAAVAPVAGAAAAQSDLMGVDPAAASLPLVERAERDETPSGEPGSGTDDSDASEESAFAALFAPLAADAPDESDVTPAAPVADGDVDVAGETPDEATRAAALAALSATHDEQAAAPGNDLDAATTVLDEQPPAPTRADDVVGGASAPVMRGEGSGETKPLDTKADTLSWLGLATETASDSPTDEPERSASTDWLRIVNGSTATTALPPAVAAAAAGQTAMGNAETRVLPAAVAASAGGGAPTSATAAAMAPAGEFGPAPPRGIRAWSSRMRWSVAISIVLLIGVVAGSVLIAQTVAANSREAQALAAAVAELEAAEAAATEPEFVLEEAVGIYDDTVELATTTAESAAPPLAAVAGMADEALLAASDTAMADLVAQLAVETEVEPPAAYERGDVDLSDVDAIAAATEVAEAHAVEVTAATDAVRLAQAALQQKLDALRAAQVALGASLPATAGVISEENPRAEQSFRDAVIAAAAAVGAAQTAGGSGDAELLAYADAVTALRADQLRAESEPPPARPANPAPLPTPTTDPAPGPAPEPTTPPEPTPTPTPTDPPPPPPEEPVVP